MWPPGWGGASAGVGGEPRERQRGQAGQRGYREDLIVLWHPQNDIIAVRVRDNNNLPSSCVNI